MRATLPEAIPRGKQFSAVRSPAGVPSARCSSSAASGCPAPYPGAMVEARKVSLWHNRYELTADGERLATWEGRSWRSGGTFDLAGRRYDVRSNAWGSRFEMTDQVGMVAATAERVGRRPRPAATGPGVRPRRGAEHVGRAGRRRGQHVTCA